MMNAKRVKKLLDEVCKRFRIVPDSNTYSSVAEEDYVKIIEAKTSSDLLVYLTSPNILLRRLAEEKTRQLKGVSSGD